MEIKRIGTTSFGGEIYYLFSEDPTIISATRIFVSMGKPIKGLIPKDITTTEDALNYFANNPEKAQQYTKYVLRFNHGDIGESSSHAFYLKGVSRLSTFIGWFPIGALRGIKGVGTERSLRYAKIYENPFVKINDRRINDIQERAVEIYSTLRKKKIPKEDARYFLPLSTKTEEIIQLPLGRDVEKWANYLIAHRSIQEVREIGRVIKKYNRRISSYDSPIEEYPRELVIPVYEKDLDEEIRKEIEKINLELYGRKGIDHKPSTKKSAKYYRLPQTLILHSERSISSFHQDIRNRQIYFYPTPWEMVLYHDFHIPYTISSLMKKDGRIRKEVEKFIEGAHDVMKGLFEKYRDSSLNNTNILVPYAILLGSKTDIYGRICGNKNVQYTIMLRSCMRAQLEIRAFYRYVIGKIQNEFPSKLGARCEVFHECFEPGKENCPLYKINVLPYRNSDVSKSI